MEYLGTFDYGVILFYFLVLVGLGLYLERRASASLEDYLVGGRRLPWWAIGVSGMASFVDIAGTMIITSFLFMLGPRGLFVEFRGGAVLVLVFMMLWTGKWHRRSQCLTGAEWMIFRFGDGPGGRFAEFTRVFAGIVFAVGMLAYLIKAAGLFLSMFLPFSPLACALVLVGVASLYTMISGFYGVVYTDIFQSAIILIAVVTISALAILRVSGAGSLANVAGAVTGNAQWMSSVPHWKTTMPAGYEAYQDLLMFAFFYLMRNVFSGMGVGDDPKYFGARSDRECSQLTFLWTWLMMFRWPMMMGFAVLGIYLAHDLFPDQQVLRDSAALIKLHVPGVSKADWPALLSSIIHAPGGYSSDLAGGLHTLLGEDWSRKLQLLSYEGTVNPERILPAVLLYEIPPGFRGLLLVALIAASMSTFDSTVNMTAGLWTRNIYQRYVRPLASTRELVYTSWGFIVVLVCISFLFAYSIQSINDIWGWIIMGLGGGMLLPTFLRFYWWRFNGGGFAVGLGCGLVAAVGQRLLFPALDERFQFLIMSAIGLAGCILGTYLTRPTDAAVLENFYRKTRPFGLWQPFAALLSGEERAATRAEHRREILAVPFAMVWQVCLFLLPMQFIIRAWGSMAVTGVLFLIGLSGVYFLWFRHELRSG